MRELRIYGFPQFDIGSHWDVLTQPLRRSKFNPCYEKAEKVQPDDVVVLKTQRKNHNRKMCKRLMRDEKHDEELKVRRLVASTVGLV
jgi:hypothetical protein